MISYRGVLLSSRVMTVQTLEWFAMPTHGMEDVQEEMLSFSSQLLGMVWSYSNNYFFVVLIIHSDNLAK